jgi:hypothetical protein
VPGILERDEISAAGQRDRNRHLDDSVHSAASIPPYLWFLGCGLVDSPASWACGGFYEGGEDYIRWNPPSVDRARFDTPASILLGIPKYTNSDLLSFSGYPTNTAIVELAQTPRPEWSPDLR